MDKKLLAQWREFLLSEPESNVEDLRAQVSLRVRQICTELAQTGDRQGAADALRRLTEIGAILEGQQWLSKGAARG